MISSTAGWSLGSAGVWGAADFAGGMATKKRSPFRVVLGVHGTGLSLAVMLALIMREPLPLSSAVLWGVAGGVSGGLALVAFYRSLAIGTWASMLRSPRW